VLEKRGKFSLFLRRNIGAGFWVAGQGGRRTTGSGCGRRGGEEGRGRKREERGRERKGGSEDPRALTASLLCGLFPPKIS